MFNEKEFKKTPWKDIAITKINDGDAIVVILMFDTLVAGNKFVENFLSKYEFNFIVSLGELTGKYSFEINFKVTDYAIRYDSELTPENYPPVAWLNKGVPCYITNGVWEKGKNRQFKYNSDIVPLNEKLESSTFQDEISKVFSK